MLAPPADLAEADLRAALARGWGVDVATLTYLPVGFGSHHWEVVDTTGIRWFVTVDLDDGDGVMRSRVDAALDTAVRLRGAGHEFVVAPVRTGDGSSVGGTGRFVVSLYSYLVGERFDYGEFATVEHLAGVVDALVRLHSIDPALAPAARTDDFAVPHRADLEQGLSEREWRPTGPFAAPAATLVARHSDAVARFLDDFDARVDAATRRPIRRVVTHGEPHAGNTMRVDGEWVLIDWETTLLAPVERDLWSLDPTGEALDTYAATTGNMPDPALLDLYRMRWDVADVTVYVRGFRGPHTGDANDVKGWEEMQRLLERIAEISSRAHRRSRAGS